MIQIPYWQASDLMDRFSKMIPEDDFTASDDMLQVDGEELVWFGVDFSFAEETEEDVIFAEIFMADGHTSEIVGFAVPFGLETGCGEQPSWLVGPASV